MGTLTPITVYRRAVPWEHRNRGNSHIDRSLPQSRSSGNTGTVGTLTPIAAYRRAVPLGTPESWELSHRSQPIAEPFLWEHGIVGTLTPIAVYRRAVPTQTEKLISTFPQKRKARN
ncbi:hypothetical protein [Leptospira gomenensis]|uniref:hypothetical protein n=1 Tax=Leptospira gomenensis TaxID=2484974 RepID=UPI0010916817|nr:hypothetical protein [Leptospira gomenensis]TGK41608.1 hypothetical protein EHQ07_16115 [Leptospira gomenensis]